MLRAIDRHKEAVFFLEKARSALYAGDIHWRYYFNAMIIAARSIALVLQKDLRSAYGNDFELWWAEQKRICDASEIINLRNVLEKEGSRWPAPVLEIDLSDGIFSSIRFELDQSLGVWGIKIQNAVTFKSEYELADVPNESPEQFEARVKERLHSLLRDGYRHFFEELARAATTSVRSIGFRMEEAGPVLSPNEIFERLAEFLSIMEGIINAAKIRFRDLPMR